jgi:hypothetical protein
LDRANRGRHSQYAENTGNNGKSFVTHTILSRHAQGSRAWFEAVTYPAC